MGFCWRPYLAGVLHSVSDQIQKLEPTKLIYHPNQNLGSEGGLRQINTCRKIPLQVNFFRWRLFALPSMSLIFLRSPATRPGYIRLRGGSFKKYLTSPRFLELGKGTFSFNSLKGQ